LFASSLLRGQWSDATRDVIYGDYTTEWVEVEPGMWELEVEDGTAYLPGIGQLDNATGNVMYTHGDQIGSLRAVTRCAVGAEECIPGETATVLQRPVYTAFGELVYDLAPQDTFIRYRYAGDWGYEGRLGSETNGGSDSALGLPFAHVGHRWYDPASGRFLQRDPIGINGGSNVYAYAASNPIRAVDPSGLEIYVNTGYPPVSPYTGGPVVTNRPAAVPPDPPARDWKQKLLDFGQCVFSPLTNNRDKITRAVKWGTQVFYVDPHQALVDSLSLGYAPDFTWNMVYPMSWTWHRFIVNTERNASELIFTGTAGPYVVRRVPALCR